MTLFLHSNFDRPSVNFGQSLITRIHNMTTPGIQDLKMQPAGMALCA
jgi:hypothetical protein